MKYFRLLLISLYLLFLILQPPIKVYPGDVSPRNDVMLDELKLVLEADGIGPSIVLRYERTDVVMLANGPPGSLRGQFKVYDFYGIYLGSAMLNLVLAFVIILAYRLEKKMIISTPIQ